MNNSGDRLKALLLECDLTPSDFAAQQRVTPQHVNNWFKRGVPHPRLDEIADLFCVQRRWLRTGKGCKHLDPLKPVRAQPQHKSPQAALLVPDDDSVQLPLHHIHQGLLQPLAGPGQAIPRQALQALSVDPQHAICLDMPASNLQPLLPPGTLLAIDRSFTQVVEGEYYALLHNGRLRVHQLTLGHGGILCLHSHDRFNHPTERYSAAQRRTQHLDILGWVFWWSCLRPARPG
ncbi:helix-turn-helix transcriptional regulator [Pantoea sp. Cy-639]|jgi:hypothetical protein|uniref:LexA family transcriptional regulator n=1 Tax=Pantoea sp. Cy-639 TaxID=2608360 RepID=UPI001421E273|nr:helix-turn-helix transcriptional regulator [Pantoea sp. Cy-639]NIF17972.1 helix-turn-helix transcriptional regulator [Pantoea sp. Cy-639]